MDVITAERVEQDKKEYLESGEQKTALLEAYTKYKGNMSQIYQVVLHSNVLDDDERFRKIIDDAIILGEVQPFDKYTKETEKSKRNRIKAATREAQEAVDWAAEQESKKKGEKAGHTKGNAGGGEAGLAAMIQRRQQDRSTSFLEQMEAKYGGGGGGGKKVKGTKRSEPPEEALSLIHI